MFRVLSGIHLGSGSVRIILITRNTIKQDPFGIYARFGSVRIHFYRIGFGLSFRVRFICPALNQRPHSIVSSHSIVSCGCVQRWHCCIPIDFMILLKCPEP